MVDRIRAEALIREAGYDGLVAALPPNVAYLTDTMLLPPAWAVIPADPALPIGLVVPETNLPQLLLRESGLLVRTFGAEAFVPPAERERLPPSGQKMAELLDLTRRTRAMVPSGALKNLLDTLELDGSRVGWDAAGGDLLPPDPRFPGSERPMAARLFRTVRAVKTQAEIDRLRIAASVNTNAVRAVFTLIEPHRQWSDLAETWRREFAIAGGENIIWLGSLSEVNQNRRPADEDLIVRHDIVAVYGRGTIGGYFTELGRLGFAGDSLPKATKLSRSLGAVFEAILAAIKPGVKLAELRLVQREALLENGLPLLAGAEIGGIGLEQNELPAGLDDVLEPGMLLAIRCPYRAVGWIDACLADVVLATPTGAQRLSDLPLEIYEGRG